MVKNEFTEQLPVSKQPFAASPARETGELAAKLPSVAKGQPLTIGQSLAAAEVSMLLSQKKTRKE